MIILAGSSGSRSGGDSDAQCVQRGEVQCGACPCADHRGKSPPPQIPDAIGLGEDIPHGQEQGGRLALLEARLQQVGGLEQDSGGAAGGQPSEKMVLWRSS